ncbi:MAG: alpha/beta hydrolase [Burkholderiaceae bacterium]
MSDSDRAEPVFAFDEVPGGRGPVMLMIHGMLSSRLQWADNVAALLPWVRPVRLELWGHGQSPSPADDSCYSVAALVDAIDAVRAKSGAERVVLCTQSFGAGLGFHYCLAHPQRVIAHIFTNSISALVDPVSFDRERNRHERIALVQDLGAAALARMPFHPRHARRLDPALRERLIEIADGTDPEAFVRLTAHTRPDLSVGDRLHELQCPTLLVNGRWEKRFQPLRDRASEALPGLRVVDLDGGHAVNMECAAAFNEAVVDFLASLPRTDFEPSDLAVAGR